MVDELDRIAEVFNMTRVDVIRRSLMRDLEYVVSHELKRTLEHQQNQQKRYRQWAAQQAMIALLKK